MTVHFIGAGPGASDLITVRGSRLLAECPICLYAGSTVDEGVLTYCSPTTQCINTAALDLEALEALYIEAHAQGKDIARLHSGDLSLYSALAEQLRLLIRHDIPYTLTPGVPAFAAASAAIERELTVPEVAQSIVLTRVSGRASAMPPTETLAHFAQSRATLAVHLAIHRLSDVVEQTQPHYGKGCPVVVVYRASWAEERIIEGTLDDIVSKVNAQPIERSALILIGHALNASAFRNSALYDSEYCRRFR